MTWSDSSWRGPARVCLTPLVLTLAIGVAACSGDDGASSRGGDGTGADGGRAATADTSSADALGAADAAVDPGAERDTTASDVAATDATDTSAADTRDSDDLADASDAVAFDATDDGLPRCIQEGCEEGFECFTTGCLPVLPVGGPCSLADGDVQCARTSSCMPTPEGDRCVPWGAEHGRCIGTGSPASTCYHQPPCEAGLGCDFTRWSGGHCRPALTAGAFCGGPGAICNAELACASIDGTLRCTPDGVLGGRCRPLARGDEPDPDLCDDDLVCSRQAPDCVRQGSRCRAPDGDGGSCADAENFCAPGERCHLWGGAATCHAPGTVGGACRDEEPRCDGEAACRSAGDGRGPGCVDVVAEGEACDPVGGRSVCAEGFTCNANHPLDDGVCVPAGVVGGDCRPDEPRCDGALVCSGFSRYRQSCREQAANGDACDLGLLRTLCPDGAGCLPSAGEAGGIRGDCAAAVAEAEPNGRADTIAAVASASTLHRGSLPSGDTEDCYAVAMDGDTSLWLELLSPADVSTSGFVIHLFDPSATEIGRWYLAGGIHGGPFVGRSRLEPSSIGALRRMAAGEYRVCVAHPERAVDTYFLSVGIIPADP